MPPDYRASSFCFLHLPLNALSNIMGQLILLPLRQIKQDALVLSSDLDGRMER
jgi:hypothetical protein